MRSRRLSRALLPDCFASRDMQVVDRPPDIIPTAVTLTGTARCYAGPVRDVTERRLGEPRRSAAWCPAAV